MRTDVARDLTWSAKAFVELAWPVVKDMVGGGELIPVESVTAHDIKRDLDTLAGIDGWHINRNKGGIRGIASRVQADGTAWNTFTIRHSRISGVETEYAKRMRAIKGEAERHWLFPALTVQVYLDKSKTELLSCGLVKTRDLFLFVERDLRNEVDPIVYTKSNGHDGNQFIVAPWDGLKSHKVEVWTWTPQGLLCPL